MLTSVALTRRRLLALVGLAGATTVTGCASGDGGGDTAATAAPGQRVASVADVPVGGALAFEVPGTGKPGVLFRRDEATFVAHSAVCTHQGCTVKFTSSTKQLDCPCHGSRFDPQTGKVLRGPAGSPLPEIPVRRSGDVIETA